MRSERVLLFSFADYGRFAFAWDRRRAHHSDAFCD